MKYTKSRSKIIIRCVSLVLVACLSLFTATGVRAAAENQALTFAAQRLERDKTVLDNLHLPKDVEFTLSKFDDSSVAISFDFPDTYNQSSIRNIISSVQEAIGKDKSNATPETSIVKPDTLIGQTTTYYFTGTQNFTGRYPGEQIYNSTYGQLASTRYPFWYRVAITGTSAGVVSNASSHYSGLSVETTVHLWGLVVGASAPGFSVSFTPGVVAEFHNQWSISSPYKYVVMDWGELVTYTTTALRLGIDNTVWVNNSGFVDPYHIYVPRTLYEY